MLYSPLKVFHHRDRIDAIRRGEQPAPSQVQLVITNRCNSRCSFCAYRLPGYTSSELFNAKDQIEYPKIVEILDDAKAMGVGAIQLTGGGEPTIHPQFIEVVRYVLSKGLDLALVTNGNAMPRASIPHVACAKWVRVSVDSGSESTYMAMRGVRAGVMQETWRTIRTLVGHRDSHKTGVVIGVGFVLTKDNYSEVVMATQRAKDEGVDNIRISAMFQSEGAKYFEPFHDEAVELCRRAKELATPSFRVFNNFGERLTDLEQGSPDHATCGYQQFDTYIGADLNLYRCCVLAYSQRGVIGSLRNHGLRELWESETKRAAFRNFDARQCPRCMFNEKNRTIAYAITTNPPHVNFV